MDSTLPGPERRSPATRILLAVEAVARSRAVIEAALVIAKRSRAELLVLSVRERESTRGLVWDCRPVSEMTELINNAIFQCERAGIPATGLIRTARSGLVAETIINVAQLYGVGTIIVGSSGRSLLGSLLSSSIGPRVVRLSRVPVIVIPTREGRPAAQVTLSLSAAGAGPKR